MIKKETAKWMYPVRTEDLGGRHYGHYKISVRNPSRRASTCVPIDKLMEFLPHGSGIDGDWTIVIKPNGDVACLGEYHCMDGNGFYRGWFTFQFPIRRITSRRWQKLSGPCEGKVQLVDDVGDIEIGPVVGLARCGYDTNGQMSDEVGYALDALIKSIPLQIPRDRRVFSEEVARGMGWRG